MGARRPHVGFFDSGRFCIHGGYLGSRVDDLWCITPEASESWTEITTIGAKPSARRLHVGFFDSGRFCIHGGSAGSRFDDLWCITPEGGEPWTEITTIGAKPSARNSHVGSIDAGRLCIHGGYHIGNVGSPLDDLWCITTTTTATA